MDNQIRLLSELDKFDPNSENYGGKFSGLKRIETLLNTYNYAYSIGAEIPKTYGIPFSFHEEYKKNGCVPESLVTRAMQCVAALGGNVAVRSSADVEDSDECSYSGKFKSVLHVKTRAQMRDALNAVYASAEAVPEAKMWIIIQPMIEKPVMAGVAYSETFFQAPFVVMNYVQGKTADKLLAHGDVDGALFAVAKCGVNEDETIEEKLSVRHLLLPRANFRFVQERSRSVRVASEEDKERYKKQFKLAALVSSLETRLGYPVDMEFAFSKKGKLYILQQRPYVFPDFVRENDGATWRLYHKKNPIIEGKASFAGSDNRVGNIIIDKDKCCVDVYPVQSMRYMVGRAMPVNPFLSIKNLYESCENLFSVINSEMGIYSHSGNMQREKLDYSWGSFKYFPPVKEGDYVRINLETLDVEVNGRKYVCTRKSFSSVSCNRGR